ncbi:N5-glutamine methyltransferase family protein, partial [Chloroflexota bacterium]
MNRKEAVFEATASLGAVGIDDAAFEAELLLGLALEISRLEIYTEPEALLAAPKLAKYRKLCSRRAVGEPYAYIAGYKEFFGLEFLVDPRVLIPRPETEMLVGAALDICRVRPESVVADIGTGSGAIAVSMAVNQPDIMIYATDASPDALAVARRNCQRHGVLGRVILLQGDLLAPLPQKADMILTNLPYVKTAELAAADLVREPRLAL